MQQVPIDKIKCYKVMKLHRRQKVTKIFFIEKKITKGGLLGHRLQGPTTIQVGKDEVQMVQRHQEPL